MATGYPSLCRSCSNVPCSRHKRAGKFLRPSYKDDQFNPRREFAETLMYDLTSPDKDERTYWVRRKDGTWEERTMKGIEKALWI